MEQDGKTIKLQIVWFCLLCQFFVFHFSFFITDNFFLKHDFFEVGFSNSLIETVTLLTGIGCLFFSFFFFSADISDFIPS